MADFLAATPSASTADGMNKVNIDIQQLFAMVQQLNEYLFHEKACKYLLQQAVIMLMCMQASPLSSIGFSSLDIKHIGLFGNESPFRPRQIA